MNESTKKILKIAKTIFLVVYGIMAVIFVIVLLNVRNNSVHSRSAKVKDLHICGVSYSSEYIPESVVVCGYIDVEPDADAELSILLFQMPNKNFVSEISHDKDIFEAGYFFRELSLNGTSGSYVVEVFLYRNIIGTMNFNLGDEI